MYVQVLEAEMRDTMEFPWKKPTIWPWRTCRNLYEVTVHVVLIKLRRIFWPGAALCRMDSNLKFIWLVHAFSKYKWMCLLCPFLDKVQVSQQSQLQWSRLNEAPHHMLLSLGLTIVWCVETEKVGFLPNNDCNLGPLHVDSVLGDLAWLSFAARK
jgi:hypothetical protein